MLSWTPFSIPALDLGFTPHAQMSGSVKALDDLLLGFPITVNGLPLLDVIGRRCTQTVRYSGVLGSLPRLDDHFTLVSS